MSPRSPTTALTLPLSTTLTQPLTVTPTTPGSITNPPVTTSPTFFSPEPALVSASCFSTFTSQAGPFSSSTSLTDIVTHSQGDPFGLSYVIPSPLASSLDFSPRATVSIDTMGDPLSPLSMDSEYVDGIDARQGQIQEVMKDWASHKWNRTNTFRSSFGRVRVSKKGYDRPSSSSNSTPQIPPKHRPPDEAHP
ncbi:hypothetical protein AMTRI_Chr01g113480 [Amborella trichopoda]